MNYEELKDFIIDKTWQHLDIINTFDKAIDAPNERQQATFLSLTISRFQDESLGYRADIEFIRAAIEYIDGLNENQDNGDEDET